MKICLSSKGLLEFLSGLPAHPEKVCANSNRLIFYKADSTLLGDYWGFTSDWGETPCIMNFRQEWGDLLAALKKIPEQPVTITLHDYQIDLQSTQRFMSEG